MLIYLKEPYYRLLTIEQGTGDHLTKEDREFGFVDYAYITIYKQDGGEIVEVDGGDLLTEKPLSKFEDEEIIERVLDLFYDETDADYVILEH